MQKIFLIFIFSITVASHSQAQDPYFTSHGDYGQTLISYQPSENILYSGTSRFRVTSTVDPANVSLLVNGKYNETAVTIASSQSATITIDFQGKGGAFVKNPEGYFYLNFFEEFHPDSVTAIIYDSTNETTGIEYEDWTNVSTTSPYILLRGHVPSWFAGLKKIEIRIKSRSAVATKVSEVDYVLARPGTFESGLVTKWQNNTLWYDLYFSDTSNTTKAFIKSTGKASFNELSIGSMSDIDTVTKLYVGGTILARRIKVNEESWPDYVFSKNYKLPSLQQVKAFIKDNNHLPGIPSAEEIQKTGLDIGKIQTALMKKIEELTLYIIRQNEKIEKLNSELKRQREQINLRN